MKLLKKHMISFCITILVVNVLFFCSCKDKEPCESLNSVRPKNFPEILIVPEIATDIHYSTPLNTKRVRDTYGVSFFIKQSFPSKDVSDFIAKHLKENGWYCLEYQLLNPRIIKSERIFDLDCIAPEHKGKPLRWDQDWIKESDGSTEVISAIFSYIDLPKKEVHLDKLFVILSFFGDESWIVPEVSKYKRFHPEEFDSASQRNPDL